MRAYLVVREKREEMLKLEPKSKNYVAEQCQSPLWVIQSLGTSRY